MDTDGVDAEVLYPTPRLSQAIFANLDVEYHDAMIRAYNDWLSEYVEYAPERFAGMAMLPNRGAEGALAELERVIDRPGHARGRDRLLAQRHARARGRRTTRCSPGSPSAASRSASTCRSRSGCRPRTRRSSPATGGSSTRPTA